MKKIYMCSKIVGNELENKVRAAEYAKYIATKCGAIPIAPQIYFPAFLDEGDHVESEIMKDACKQLLRECNEFWYFGDGVTMSTVEAILAAREMNIPVRYVSDREIGLQSTKE